MQEETEMDQINWKEPCSRDIFRSSMFNAFDARIWVKVYSHQMDKSLKKKASITEVAPCTFIISANQIVNT